MHLAEDPAEGSPVIEMSDLSCCYRPYVSIDVGCDCLQGALLACVCFGVAGDFDEAVARGPDWD